VDICPSYKALQSRKRIRQGHKNFAFNWSEMWNRCCDQNNFGYAVAAVEIIVAYSEQEL
jgi:hypothetical protein